MPLFEARGLTKYYNRRVVVNHVDFEVNRGEVVGMLGPNGAGKTTAFRMSIGMIRPNGGKVYFDGHDVSDLPMYRRARLGMSYLAQESSVFQRLTVEDNLLAILEMKKLGRATMRLRTESMLEEFGLSHIADHLAYTLSGGERRRLEIARCLCTKPTLILLDEPFTGIDPIAVGELQGLVRNLKFRGIGVLITDHNVLESLRITDRAYIMSEGRVITQGTSEELLEDPIARKHYLGYRIQRAHIAEGEPPVGAEPQLPEHSNTPEGESGQAAEQSKPQQQKQMGARTKGERDADVP